MPELGDFMVTATPGFVARMIRLITHSKVNHAAVYVGERWLVEACPSGAQPTLITHYPNATWSSLPLTASQRSMIATRAVDMIGTPYNFLDIAAQLAVRVFRWHAPQWALDRVARPDRLQCAQLVDLAYQLAGVHLFKNVPMGLVAPGDLYDLIEAKHG